MLGSSSSYAPTCRALTRTTQILFRVPRLNHGTGTAQAVAGSSTAEKCAAIAMSQITHAGSVPPVWALCAGNGKIRHRPATPLQPSAVSRCPLGPLLPSSLRGVHVQLLRLAANPCLRRKPRQHSLNEEHDENSLKLQAWRRRNRLLRPHPRRRRHNYLLELMNLENYPWKETWRTPSPSMEISPPPSLRKWTPRPSSSSYSGWKTCLSGEKSVWRKRSTQSAYRKNKSPHNRRSLSCFKVLLTRLDRKWTESEPTEPSYRSALRRSQPHSAPLLGKLTARARTARRRAAFNRQTNASQKRLWAYKSTTSVTTRSRLCSPSSYSGLTKCRAPRLRRRQWQIRVQSPGISNHSLRHRSSALRTAAKTKAMKQVRRLSVMIWRRTQRQAPRPLSRLTRRHQGVQEALNREACLCMPTPRSLSHSQSSRRPAHDVGHSLAGVRIELKPLVPPRRRPQTHHQQCWWWGNAQGTNVRERRRNLTETPESLHGIAKDPELPSSAPWQRFLGYTEWLEEHQCHLRNVVLSLIPDETTGSPTRRPLKAASRVKRSSNYFGGLEVERPKLAAGSTVWRRTRRRFARRAMKIARRRYSRKCRRRRMRCSRCGRPDLTGGPLRKVGRRREPDQPRGERPCGHHCGHQRGLDTYVFGATAACSFGATRDMNGRLIRLPRNCCGCGAGHLAVASAEKPRAFSHWPSAAYPGAVLRLTAMVGSSLVPEGLQLQLRHGPRPLLDEDCAVSVGGGGGAATSSPASSSRDFSQTHRRVAPHPFPPRRLVLLVLLCPLSSLCSVLARCPVAHHRTLRGDVAQQCGGTGVNSHDPPRTLGVKEGTATLPRRAREAVRRGVASVFSVSVLAYSHSLPSRFSSPCSLPRRWSPFLLTGRIVPPPTARVRSVTEPQTRLRWPARLRYDVPII